MGIFWVYSSRTLCGYCDGLGDCRSRAAAHRRVVSDEETRTHTLFDGYPSDKTEQSYPAESGLNCMDRWHFFAGELKKIDGPDHREYHLIISHFAMEHVEVFMSDG